MIGVEIEAKGPLFDGSYEEIIFSETERAFVDIGRIVETAWARRAPEGATGALRGSIVAEVSGNSLNTLRGRVFPAAPHVRAVEFGRRPGAMPPWGEGSSLHQWVERKLGVGSERSVSVSFLIARAIARRGVSGQGIFTKALNDSQGAIEERIDLLGARIAEKLSG